MQEFNVRSRSDEDLIKVSLNDNGEYIVLNPNDSTFVDRFSQFLKWLEEKQIELNEQAEEAREKYGDTPMIVNDGDNVEVDAEQFTMVSGIRTKAYSQCVEKLDEIFGAGTMRKFFAVHYDLNPAFVPDEECINDFIEQISPAVNAAYDARYKRINSKYSKSRKGGRRKTSE